MAHEGDIAEIDVLDCLECLFLSILSDALQEGFSQALEDDGVITGQVLEKSLANFEYLFGVLEALDPSFGLGAEIEDITEQVDGDLLKGDLYQMWVFNVEIL